MPHHISFCTIKKKKKKKKKQHNLPLFANIKQRDYIATCPLKFMFNTKKVDLGVKIVKITKSYQIEALKLSQTKYQTPLDKTARSTPHQI